MQVERVAIFIGFGLFQAVAEPPFFGQRVATETLSPQAGVDFAQRLLANHAGAPGGEFPPVAVADVSRIAQRLEKFLEIVERIGRLVVQQLPQGVLIDTIDISAPLRLPHLFDELIQIAHLAHEPHRGFEIKFVAATEYIALAFGIQEVHFLGQFDEFGLKVPDRRNDPPSMTATARAVAATTRRAGIAPPPSAGASDQAIRPTTVGDCRRTCLRTCA